MSLLSLRRDVDAAVRRGWLTSREAATYLGFDSCQDPRRAFRSWVRRHGVPSARRGRVLLFDQRDLDAAVGSRRR